MSNSGDDGRAAVQAVMERYVDAVFNADIATLKEVFHPQAAMCGYLGDKLLIGTPQPFLEDLATHPSMAKNNDPFRGIISGVGVMGRAATATLEETGFFGAGHFVNYFHLLDFDGEWKITSKIFASL
ncbi:MAG: hypothetical protein A2133_04320 [Actinobacteria bacterium RBG_16_64_13]|nr:MAG: hypothetical protein A2133_04320 [Actinobacteria bacterium RBG_16_64_13]